MKLAVLGVGLIGGSIGLAAHATGGLEEIHVSGYDPDRRALDAALARGAIDRACGSVAEAVSDAEVALIAAPVGALERLAREALRAAPPGCVVSDVGSTKGALVAAIEDERFVGGHPLAGAESAGVEHARAELFAGAAWYLTPRPGTPPALLERLCDTLARLGARPVRIDAAAHDRLMASVSHLPHVLANVLVEGAAAVADGGDGAVGPSFRDATRVAGANTAIWTDIYLANGQAVIEAIDDAVTRLARVREALARGDARALAAWNERARDAHARLTGADGRDSTASPAPGAEPSTALGVEGSTAPGSDS